MKSSSAKAKGRRLQQWVCQQVSDITGFEWGKDESIASREMGQTGTDVRLSGRVREEFPFAVECKCQETWQVQAWTEQAEKNLPEDLLAWLLVLKRNHKRPLAVMDARFFFRMWKALLSNVAFPVQDLEGWFEEDVAKVKRREEG